MNNTNFIPSDLDQEIAELKTELEDNPDDLVLKITIASALERVGKFDEAGEFYQQVINEDKDGRLAASAKKAIGAMPIVVPKQIIPDAFKERIKAIEVEIAQDPDDLIAQINLGTILEQAGQQEQAKLVYEQVIDRDSEGILGETARKALAAMGKTSAQIAKSTSTSAPIISASPTDLKDPAIEQKFLDKWQQRFYNLPIAKKQLYSLLLSEVIALGLVGTGAILLVSGLRSQLLQQSQSELAITQANYNSKLDQMGLGFRGQAKNAAVIDHLTQNLPTGKVKEILRNELWTRKIEFAALVDSKGRLVAGAGSIPKGDIFNPNNLVTKALGANEQVKSSELITYDELAKESSRFAKLLAEAKNTDPQSKPSFLIRYTVTPVQADNGQIIGALVSGDIVKNAIVAQTNNSFQDGYSAVYLNEGNGKFSLATAEKMKDGRKLADNLSLPNSEILSKAIEAKGAVVSQWKYLGNENYAFSVKAINNSEGKPIAVLVRGTSPDRLNALLLRILSLQTLFIIIGSILTILLARFLAKALAEPIARLRESTLKFADGDRAIRAEIFASDEVGELANTFNAMADSIVVSETAKEKQAKQRQAEAEFQKREKEILQQGVMRLLTEIDGAKTGDLTVKAKVEEGEMGSIADAFNATIRSLREIVDRVKVTAVQVQDSAQTNESSVQKLSAEAQEQVDAITNTLNSLEEMDRSIQSVAQSAQSAAQIAREALNATQTGDRLMAETVDSIDQIRSSVADTSKKMKRLAESSQEISQIIGIISTIAEKTNLLAFNASLEASRAGENGQGFRIVADEVRRLAERVTDSLRDVEQLVSGIQSETAEVLQTMEASTNQVVTGTKLVRQTQGTLQQVAQIGQQIDELLQSISASTVSQADYSQKVTGTMQEVVNISQQTSAESQAVSASLQQLLAIATKLQESVAQFKVS
jgi:twitching motility protein PilJ